jgi:hypothetical protein
MQKNPFSLLKHLKQKRYSTPLCAVSLALNLIACDPYTSRTGQYNAGPVDPITFPPENLGLSRTASFAGRFKGGSGKFIAISANLSASEKVDYFRFALPTPAVAPDAMPKPVIKPFAIPASAPRVYVFDPQGTNPFVKSGCKAPANYAYDPQVNDIALDEQGAIFTALPTANYDPSAGAAGVSTEVPVTLLGGARAYGPIVNTVPVTTADMACQSTKSEPDLAARKDVTLELGEANASTGRRIGVGSGKYAAAVIIDPGAPVYDSFFDGKVPTVGSKTPQGLGLQRWGWYNQFLLAYIEGGYLPTVEVAGKQQFKPQRIFVPKKILGKDMLPADGVVGAGYDVMEFKRGAEGYSPLCQLVFYDTPTPVAPSALPKSAADVVANFGTSLKPGEVFYCLQVQP